MIMNINEFKELLKQHGLDAAKEATDIIALLNKVHTGKASALETFSELRDELNVDPDTAKIIILAVANASGIKRPIRVMGMCIDTDSFSRSEAGTNTIFKGEIDTITDMLKGISISESYSILETVRKRIEKTIVV